MHWSKSVGCSPSCNRRRIHHRTRPFSLVRSSCSLAGQDWPVLGRCKLARYSNAPSRCFFALPFPFVSFILLARISPSYLFAQLKNSREKGEVNVTQDRRNSFYRRQFIILGWNWIKISLVYCEKVKLWFRVVSFFCIIYA